MKVPAAFVLLWLGAPPARLLTLDERVEAQRAVERVYYSHQIGATLPFGEAVPLDSLERKVDTYLRQSLALERFWHSPITAEQLASEMSRMVSDTRMPDRLREVFDALGNDMFLIQETFVRQELAVRLAREAFASDGSIHAEERGLAESLRARLARGDVDLHAPHPGRIVVVLKLAGSSPETPLTASAIVLDPDRFASWRSLAPARTGEVGPVVEEHDTFVIRVLLDESPGRARIASYTIPKTTWDSWWDSVRAGLDPNQVAPVAGFLPQASMHAASRRGALPAASPSCPTIERWTPTSTDDAPISGAAVWSGHEMIVWDDGSGGRYAPSADSWVPTSSVDSPSPRYGHTLIWTGNVVTAWGGLSGSGYLDSGGRYNPVTDTWTATSSNGAPQPRYLHTAVWTGADMIVWGGGSFDSDNDRFVGLETGALYDPINDTWTTTPTGGAPAGRLGHTAIWTGSEMVVWGGHSEVVVYLDDGGRLDPDTGTWSNLSTSGSPAQRWLHEAVWTGKEMIIWGGTNNGAVAPFTQGPLISGGRYDPATDNWRATSTIGAPEPRWGFTSVWSGRSMIVWGGASSDLSYRLNTGARYDPVDDSWTPTTTNNAPEPRSGHTAVWTGDEMIVWGGSNGATLNTGGRYAFDQSLDADADGYTACEGDCDDANPLVSPAAVERPGNSIDENCDGEISCDPGAAWKNRGSFLRCVVQECRRLVASRAVTRQQCAAIIGQAHH